MCGSNKTLYMWWKNKNDNFHKAKINKFIIIKHITIVLKSLNNSMFILDPHNLKLAVYLKAGAFFPISNLDHKRFFKKKKRIYVISGWTSPAGIVTPTK